MFGAAVRSTATVVQAKARNPNKCKHAAWLCAEKQGAYSGIRYRLEA